VLIRIAPDAVGLGKAAAHEAAEVLRAAIAQRGSARIVLSTGVSQFATLACLTEADGIDWSKVEMFHMDEYVDLPITHKASFRKYLIERFVEPTGIATYHFVTGTQENVEELTRILREKPVDLGLIGIGENGHIAFNDPPADFETTEAFIYVTLDMTCKKQQVREGWFKTIGEVPDQAVSMTPFQIMQCETIISAVPYMEKAVAVKKTLESPLTNEVPATLLKTHPRCHLYVDSDSFSLTDEEKILPLQTGIEIERI
jgi:glucosamine-6-phosphate deaminase